MLPTEVFLSHSNLDRQFAASIDEVMQRHGIPAWYSRKNIVGAQQGMMRLAPRFTDAIGLSSSSLQMPWSQCG
jgi:hypothetical protein